MTFHGAYGCLNVIRTLFAPRFCIRETESQPERPANSNFGLMIVCHVKIRSSALTWTPSLHFALLLIVASRVNGAFLTIFALPM